MNTELIEYNITDLAIKEMSDKYMILKVNGVDDKEGVKKITQYRKEVKSKRTEIEAKRKVLKADSISYGKKVDSEAKRITALLKPIEDHLIEQEDIVKNEIARLKAEEQRKIEEAHQARIQLLIDYGVVFNGSTYVYGENSISDNEIRLLNEESFGVTSREVRLWKTEQELKLAREEEERRVEAEKQAKIAEENRIAQEKLDKQREEQEEQARKIKEAQDKIDEENRKQEEQKRIDEARKTAIEEAKKKAIEDEKRHKIELEEAKKKAAEDAKKEAFEKEKAKIEAGKKAKAAAEKKAKLLPEKEKLLAFSEKLLSPNLPELKTKEGKVIVEKIKSKLGELASMIKDSANSL